MQYSLKDFCLNFFLVKVSQSFLNLSLYKYHRERSLKMMILDHYCLSSSSALGNTADGSQEMSFLPSTPKTVLRGPWMKPRDIHQRFYVIGQGDLVSYL